MSYDYPGAPPPPPPPPPGYGSQPPPPPPAPAKRRPRWPWIVGGVVVLLLVVAAVAGGGEDEPEADDAAATTETTTAEQATQPETTTTEAPTTTTIPTVSSGVYAVPGEFAPGTYRVAGYWARLDAAQEIIDNDIGAASGDGLLLLDVQPTDAFIEINGEATALANWPAVDPIAGGFTYGTYLVGVDIAPGQYRVTPAPGDSAYWARLDSAHEIIDNNISEGQLIVIVQEGDYALTYTGTLEVMA